ncbi:MAG TPA: T9SS type A sorting domain-containing protein, partial [Bacteroidetes bacterium]|nr:T9SS type A sorting domain-containing protein [Bacteroidota bacterium]
YDELVFMVRDLGDKAPDRLFIDNEEAKTHPKIELIVQDPDNPALKAYGYIFRSSTIPDTVPKPYGFSYDLSEDRITTKYYTIGMNENGTVDDIVIKDSEGNGEDIFDLLKIRFLGVIDFFITVPDVILDEGSLYLYPEKYTTEHPVVRMIRYVNMTLEVAGVRFDEITFPVTSKFYPFSGTIKGGTSLAPQDLIIYYGGVIEIQVILKHLRESWDYNSNAIGMKFYNQYNNGLIIDGNPDLVNKTVDIPVNAWDLTTGEQGSLFKIGQFKEQKWGSVELYYYDNKNGGQGDSDIFLGDIDTGDQKSYGDNGILFCNKDEQDSVTIELNYTVYFLPEKHLTQSDGERLAHFVNNPVKISPQLIAGVEQREQSIPTSFSLKQNYPNPFNNSTVIPFNLLTSGHVQLQIFDSNGSLVKTLADGWFISGTHHLYWDGSDDNNRQVPSGIYFCRISILGLSQTRKLLFIK